MENPYGEAVQADKAPEAISKAVASLPPEQMFELMKQMKLCVQNNPSEARAMLLQNPQLAYALLQAQVVMRIVDPHTAVVIYCPYCLEFIRLHVVFTVLVRELSNYASFMYHVRCTSVSYDVRYSTTLNLFLVLSSNKLLWFPHPVISFAPPPNHTE